jgi:hypothetical protein
MNDIVNSNVITTLFVSLMVAFEKAFTNSVTTRPSDPFDFKGKRSTNGENVADRMQTEKYSGQQNTLAHLGRSNTTTYNIIGTKSKDARMADNSELSALLNTFKYNVRRNPMTNIMEFHDDNVQNYGVNEYFYNFEPRAAHEKPKHTDAEHFAEMIEAIKKYHDALLTCSNERADQNPFFATPRDQIGNARSNGGNMLDFLFENEKNALKMTRPPFSKQQLEDRYRLEIKPKTHRDGTFIVRNGETM